LSWASRVTALLPLSLTTAVKKAAGGTTTAVKNRRFETVLRRRRTVSKNYIYHYSEYHCLLRISVLSIEMEYLFWFYVFLSFVVTTGGAYTFFSNAQQIAAGIFFVGATSLTIYFGFRWFPASGSNLVKTPTWNPVMNYCPDFLTLNKINDEHVCVDTIGVAQAGGIARWSDATQTDEQYLFHLYTNTYGSDRVTRLCNQAKAKKVTWEGVWNGSTCIGGEPPLPPKTP